MFQVFSSLYLLCLRKLPKVHYFNLQDFAIDCFELLISNGSAEPSPGQNIYLYATTHK